MFFVIVYMKTCICIKIRITNSVPHWAFTILLTVVFNLLRQDSANLFCKGSDNKYFMLSWPQLSIATHFCLGSLKVAIDSMQTNECGYIPTQLYLWRLKYEFCILFIYHKASTFDLFPTTENVKTILTLQAMPKQVAGWIWPADQFVDPCSTSWMKKIELLTELISYLKTGTI